MAKGNDLTEVFSYFPSPFLLFLFNIFCKIVIEKNIKCGGRGDEMISENGTGAGWREYLLWLPCVREKLRHSFWKEFRKRRCKVLSIELYTIADRDQVLIVTSQVESGFYKSKVWEMMVRYNPAYDATGRKAAVEVRKQIQELTQHSDLTIYTSNFYFWVNFLDFLRAEHLYLSKLADPSESSFRFVVSW